MINILCPTCKHYYLDIEGNCPPCGRPQGIGCGCPKLAKDG